MSFIKITTRHPGGRETVGITQQANVTAGEAFDRRVTRARVARQPHDADRSSLTIHIHPTEIVDYSQLLEYAETIEAFDGNQPELPQEFFNLMEKPQC
ncbi:hypothetical protein QYM46_13115 [Brevibacterium sp. K11IcPPYGO002]|uniref:hypothetical protein n=1 Tax=Brevibacterium sp. K11IcPPYGO002 TaxID=3058837 RepID=UPI003D81A95D